MHIQQHKNESVGSPIQLIVPTIISSFYVEKRRRVVPRHKNFYVSVSTPTVLLGPEPINIPRALVHIRRKYRRRSKQYTHSRSFG